MRNGYPSGFGGFFSSLLDPCIEFSSRSSILDQAKIFNFSIKLSLLKSPILVVIFSGYNLMNNNAFRKFQHKTKKGETLVRGFSLFLFLSYSLYQFLYCGWNDEER